MIQEGFEEVYHLEGGILKYLEEVPVEKSLWEGECFVFDRRVSVDHDLQPGRFTMCRACGTPLDQAERSSPLFTLGVSCPYCHAETSEAQKAGFAERQRQVELAQSRGENHLRDQKVATARKKKK